MEHRKYIEWIDHRRRKNAQKAETVFEEAEKAIEANVIRRHLPYRKEKLTELRELMRQCIYLERDLRTELDKIDFLVERWNRYQNPETSPAEREQHRSFIRWCGFNPDDQTEYLELLQEHQTVSLQIKEAEAIQDALAQTAPSWWGHDDFHLDADLKLTAQEQLRHSLSAIKANRKKLGQIAYSRQKAADRRIYKNEYLEKAVDFRELWHKELMKEKAVKAKIRQLRKSSAPSRRNQNLH